MNLFRWIVSLIALMGLNLNASEESGNAEGLLVSKGEYFLVVKSEGQEAQKFVPYWRGGLPRDGGGFDQETLKNIKDIKPGSKIHVQWKQDEFKRIVRVDVLEQPKPLVIVAQNEDRDIRGKANTGTSTGTIRERHKRRIILKTENGDEDIFFPMHDGAADLGVMRQLGEVKNGDTLKVEWEMRDGRRTITKIHRAD